MNRRRAESLPRRGVWSWPERIAYWAYGFLIGPFLSKLPDGTVQGSMTRWAVAAFTVAEVYRLVRINVLLGPWEAAAIFFILFALPIDAALSAARPKDVLDLLARALPGGPDQRTTATLVQEPVTPDTDTPEPS